MKRLFLLVVAVGVALNTVPNLREKAAPVVNPAKEYLADGLEGVGSGISNAVFRWSVHNALKDILDHLELQLNVGERIPSAHRFTRYLQAQRSLGAIDPWGVPYYLEFTRDEMIVGSNGPDRERGTADDVRSSRSR